jgi:hypothetical protein
MATESLLSLASVRRCLGAGSVAEAVPIWLCKLALKTDPSLRDYEGERRLADSIGTHPLKPAFPSPCH